MCFEGYIVEVKLLLDKNFTNFIMWGKQAPYFTCFVEFCWTLFLGPICRRSEILQPALISHIDFSMYNILVFL